MEDILHPVQRPVLTLPRDLREAFYPALEGDWRNDERTESDIWGPRFAVMAAVLWAVGAVLGFRTSVSLLTALGFVAAGIGLFRPVIGLLSIGMLCTLDALMRNYLMTGGLFRWNTFNYWLLLTTFCMLPLVIRMRDRHMRWLLPFALLLIVELLVSPSLSGGANHVLNLLAVIGLQVYFVRSTHDENAFYWVGVVAGVTAAAGGGIFFLQKASLPRIDENAFSYFPLTGLFAVCLAFRTAVERGFGLRLLGALATANMCWVILSGSRGGMLVATACALYLVTEIPGRSRRFTMVTVATISLLALTLQFESLRERAIGRVWQLLDPQQSAADRTSGRSDLAVGAWLIFLDNPLGVGTGGFPAYWAQVSLRRDVGFSGYKRGEEQTCHSGWMKTLSENGVPGFLLLAGYVLSFGFTGWAQGVHGRIGVLTTVCLSLAFFSTEFAGKGLWFLAAGTCVLLSRHATTTTVAHEI